MNKVYIECDCGAEMVRLAYDPEWPELEICFWDMGHSRDHRTGFMRKWNLIKRILKHGTPYGDMVLIQPDKAKELRHFLTDYIAAKDEPKEAE